MSVREICDEISNVLNGLPNMKSVPNIPVERPPDFPFGACQPSSGVFDTAGSLGYSLKNERHSVLAFILVQRDKGSLEDRIDDSIDFADLFIERLQAQFDSDKLAGTVDIVEQVAYSYDVITWGGIPCLGYVFTIDVLRTQC